RVDDQRSRRDGAPARPRRRRHHLRLARRGARGRRCAKTLVPRSKFQVPSLTPGTGTGNLEQTLSPESSSLSPVSSSLRRPHAHELVREAAEVEAAGAQQLAVGSLEEDTLAG